MPNIQESTHTINFDTALLAAATRATAAHPHASARIAKGLALVQADAVTDMTLVAPRLFRVRSATHPGIQYEVVSNGETRCTCPDFLNRTMQHPAYLCKHAYSVLLIRAARRDLASPRLRHAYHWAHGEGTCRYLKNGRVVFHPGGHRHHLECDVTDLRIGPYVHAEAWEGVAP